MIFTVTYDSKSLFVPSIDIQFYAAKMDQQHIVPLANLVKEKEDYILNELTIPNKRQEDPLWLTGRLYQYNFLKFEHDSVRYLNEFIRTEYIKYMEEIGNPPGITYIQCWANIMRPGGRKISTHNHSAGNRPWLDPELRTEENLRKETERQGYSYLSGNISIQTNETSTFFQNPFLNREFYGIKNFNGEMILFPSHMNHTTDKQSIDSERITISFDIITQKLYDLITDLEGSEDLNYIRLT